MFSFQADAIPAAMVVVWSQMPTDFKRTIPQEWLLYGAVVFFILGMIGRLVYQPKTHT